MNFEIVTTIEEVIGNNIQCKLNYTQDFVDYDEWVDGRYEDVEPLKDGLIESLENLIKEYKDITSIEATAFISDDDSYVYVDVTDTNYMFAMLPVGNNKKYRACFVNTVY